MQTRWLVPPKSANRYRVGVLVWCVCAGAGSMPERLIIKLGGGTPPNASIVLAHFGGAAARSRPAHRGGMILYGRDYYYWRNCGFVTTMIGREMFRMSGSVVPRAIPVAAGLALLGWAMASGIQLGWYTRLEPDEECRIILPSGRVLDAMGNETAISSKGVLLTNDTAVRMLIAGGKQNQTSRSPRCESFFKHVRQSTCRAWGRPMRAHGDLPLPPTHTSPARRSAEARGCCHTPNGAAAA